MNTQLGTRRPPRQQLLARRSNWTNDGNMAGSFNEFRVYSGLMTEAQITANTAAGPNAVPDADTDNDNIPDWYELRYGLNRNSAADATSDTDADGVNALDEFRRGSRPNAADSDGDGLADSAETNTGMVAGPTDTGTHPLKADTDSDGATDAAEVAAGSNPFLFDADGDGVNDGVEIAQGSNPNSNGPANPPLAHRWPFNNPAAAANDGDPSPDVIGGSPAFIRGEGATFTGTGVQLAGRGQRHRPVHRFAERNRLEPSRRLSRGMVFGRVHSKSWGRVFDFGDSLGEELDRPGRRRRRKRLHRTGRRPWHQLRPAAPRMARRIPSGRRDQYLRLRCGHTHRRRHIHSRRCHSRQ